MVIHGSITRLLMAGHLFVAFLSLSTQEASAGSSASGNALSSAQQEQDEGQNRRRNRDGRNRRRGNRGEGRRGQQRVDPVDVAEKLPELQKKMWKELDLSAGQREAIDEIFEDQMDVVREAVLASKDTDRAKEIERNRRAMTEAKRSGDTDAEDEAREAISELMREKAEAEDVKIAGFVRRINRELDADQQDDFRTLIRQSGLIRANNRGNRLRLYRTALMHEDVGLDDEQREDVRKAMQQLRPGNRGEGRQRGQRRERRQGMEQGQRADREKMEADFREAIEEILTADQMEAFEAKLKEFETNPPERNRRSGQRRRGRGSEQPERH
ncbi:MAG: hypothetical protein ACPGXK_03055 [Phycisphaerae bacterium]